MSFTHWLSKRLGLPRPASRRRAPAARRTFRPRLECLEERCVPSVLPVTSTLDDVSRRGTLRYAVAHANDGDTILLTGAVEQAGITLTQGELLLDRQGLAIQSVGNTPTTISGGGNSRIFEV